MLEYVLISQMSVLFSKMSVYCMCACEREARGRLSNLPLSESCDSSELLDVAERSAESSKIRYVEMRGVEWSREERRECSTSVSPVFVLLG